MPVSTMMFLYSMVILTGAALVVYGLASGNGRKAASPAGGRRRDEGDFSTVTADVVALRFLDEEMPLEGPPPGVSRRARRRFASKAGAGEGDGGRNPSRFARIFAAPFRALTRRGRGKDESGIEKPVTSPIFLDARTPDADSSDVGVPDAGVPDTATPDAGSRDAAGKTPERGKTAAGE